MIHLNDHGHPPEATTGAADGVGVAVSMTQGIGYLGLLVAAGLLVFAVWILPAAEPLRPVRRRLRTLTWAATVAAVLAGVLVIPLGSAVGQGLPLEEMFGAAAWSKTDPRTVASTVMLVLGLVVGAACLKARPPSGTEREVITAATVLALVSPVVVGHSRSHSPQLLVWVSDLAHVATASVWFGGLLGIALVTPALSRRPVAGARVVARFSALAAGMVGVVAFSGVMLAWRILGSWSALGGTTYGRLLLVKVGLVLLVLALAAGNRAVLVPGVQALAEGHEVRRAAARLGFAVRVEATLLVVVVLATGFLVNLSTH